MKNYRSHAMRVELPSMKNYRSHAMRVELPSMKATVTMARAPRGTHLRGGVHHPLRSALGMPARGLAPPRRSFCRGPCPARLVAEQACTGSTQACHHGPCRGQGHHSMAPAPGPAAPPRPPPPSSSESLPLPPKACGKQHHQQCRHHHHHSL
jgi:hypothetical protein